MARVSAAWSRSRDHPDRAKRPQSATIIVATMIERDRAPVDPASAYGQELTWHPEIPRLHVQWLVITWVVGAASVGAAAWLLPGMALERSGAAFLVAALVAILNAIVPPVLAALRLPYMVGLGFILLLLADALVLRLAAEALPDEIHIASFGDALLAALVISAVSLCLQVIIGTNDDDEYTLRVTRRIARRQGPTERTDVPGIVFLEIDGLALPILRDAMRDGSAPNLARWIAQDGHHLVEWETDLSSQTGASQAGILLGSNEDIPAFRWVEKETGRLMTCSSPADCAEIESRHATGVGLLVGGGASRGNLLSGEADEVILTVSRTGRGAPCEPRLPRVLRERVQRLARARPVLLGGRARVHRRAAGGPPRRPAARAPGRDLSGDARRRCA